jgi:murein DD-endopeptidase MepM/ murein hydrolase activator NlpD
MLPITMMTNLKRNFVFLLPFLLISCATFRGPDPLVLGNQEKLELNPEETTITVPEHGRQSTGLSLNGAREFSPLSTEVRFDWPVDQARMSRGFFASPARRKRPHWGIDLASNKGTPILAAEKGVVIYTGRAFHGYGRLIVIEHGSDWATMYGHLDKIAVKEGQEVEKGQVVGQMGRTGRATGVHLHFEVRHFRQPVNPLAYLPPIPGSRVSGQPGARLHEHSYQLLSQDSQ